MTTAQWTISVIAGLVGGGAMGAVLTAIITKYRARRQLVGLSTEFIPVLHKTPNFPSIRAILMDESSSGSGPGHPVENLYLARITILNKGNQDMNEYKVGITLSGSDKAINVITKTLDRHHSMRLETPVSLAAPRSELDFTCVPFNRNEPYTANVYFTSSGAHSGIKFSSPHSTQFTDIGNENRTRNVIVVFALVFVTVIMLLLDTLSMLPPPLLSLSIPVQFSILIPILFLFQWWLSKH